MKKKWTLGIAAVVLVAAVFAGGFFSGRWFAGNRENQQENWDNFSDGGGDGADHRPVPGKGAVGAGAKLRG